MWLSHVPFHSSPETSNRRRIAFSTRIRACHKSGCLSGVPPAAAAWLLQGRDCWNGTPDCHWYSTISPLKLCRALWDDAREGSDKPISDAQMFQSPSDLGNMHQISERSTLSRAILPSLWQPFRPFGVILWLGKIPPRWLAPHSSTSPSALCTRCVNDGPSMVTAIEDRGPGWRGEKLVSDRRYLTWDSC
jgi:hypothetical protein